MVKVLKWIVYTVLFVYLVSSNMGRTMFNGIGEIVGGFYTNVLAYGSPMILVIFAFFMFIVGYGIIKH